MHQKPTKTCITSAEFGRLYSDYNPRFTEVAYRYVRDRGIAEDLVSDSFMAFWEERDRLPEDVNAPAYVLTIVKNKCLNHLKARLLHLQIEKKLHSTQQRLIQSDIQSLAACVPDTLFVEEMQTMLDRAVGRMPELTRRIFEGSRYEKLQRACSGVEHRLHARQFRDAAGFENTAGRIQGLYFRADHTAGCQQLDLIK